jgi:hypothetical protein
MQVGSYGVRRWVAAAALALVSPIVWAQTNPVYMALGPAKAMYYKPDAGPAPRVAFLIVHRT